MTSGADASVTSVHKILPAVSQGSVLHLQGERVDYNRVATAVRMMSTTSPMLPIVASLDAARRQMAISGTQLYERVLSLSDRARQEISAIGGYELLTAEALGIPERRHDRTKLVIDVHRLGLTGYDVEHQLNHQHAIAIESADWRGIVANFNIAETDESANRFVNALRSIVDGSPGQERSEIGTRATGKLLDAPVQSMLPRDAYFAHSRQVRLTESVGEVAAELVTPYPPGIPVLAPGELITADRVAYLMGIYKRGAVNYGNHHWSVDRMISVVAEPV
jgi:arginine/lysine/ornithine decarboxylase